MVVAEGDSKLQSSLDDHQPQPTRTEHEAQRGRAVFGVDRRRVRRASASANQSSMRKVSSGKQAWLDERLHWPGALWGEGLHRPEHLTLVLNGVATAHEAGQEFRSARGLIGWGNPQPAMQGPRGFIDCLWAENYVGQKKFQPCYWDCDFAVAARAVTHSWNNRNSPLFRWM